MQNAMLNGAELEYEVAGSGEPLLLISNGPIADSFLPFRSERALAGRYRLITYRQRGQSAGTVSPAAVSFAAHAADAAALLGHLEVRRAHVAGHSTGACIALQLAVDHPGLVHTLALLEPPLLGVPSTAAFFEKAAPALEAYGAGDHGGAVAEFLSMVSGLAWERCRATLERHVPGAVERAVSGADAFFGSYLPSLGAWDFGPGQAAAITRPVLSVRGSDSERLFVEGHELLHSWFPQLESRTIEGVAHLLQLQRPEPVARCVAEFAARHPIAAYARGTEAPVPVLRP